MIPQKNRIFTDNNINSKKNIRSVKHNSNTK